MDVKKASAFKSAQISVAKKTVKPCVRLALIPLISIDHLGVSWRGREATRRNLLGARAVVGRLQEARAENHGSHWALTT